MVRCPNCQFENMEGARFCSNCGVALLSGGGPAPVQPPYGPGYYQPYSGYPVVPQKDPGLAAVIALLAGIFGLMGMGHIYVGRITRGLIILVSAIAIWFLAFLFFFVGVFSFGGVLWVIGLVCLIAALGLLVWQTYDAYSLARQYNSTVRQTGRAPW